MDNGNVDLEFMISIPYELEFQCSAKHKELAKALLKELRKSKEHLYLRGLKAKGKKETSV